MVNLREMIFYPVKSNEDVLVTATSLPHRVAGSPCNPVKEALYSQPPEAQRIKSRPEAASVDSEAMSCSATLHSPASPCH